VRSARFDKELRFNTGVAICTAALLSVFTGGFVACVARAGASSVISSTISQACRKKKSPMDEAMEMARSQHGHPSSSTPRVPLASTTIQKKAC